MKTLDAAFITALINEQYDFAVFTKLTYANGNTLTYTNRDVAVKYDGDMYTPHDLAIDVVNYSPGLAVDNIVLRYGNADRTFSSVLLGSGDVIGSSFQVVFSLMENLQPKEDSAIVLFSGTVSNFFINGEKEVTINVVNHLIFWNKRSLRKAFSTCRWNFQGIECGYGDLINEHDFALFGAGNSNKYVFTDYGGDNTFVHWAVANCSVLQNRISFTLGEASAGEKIVDTEDNAQHYLFYQMNGLATNTWQTFSVMAKKAERSKIAIFGTNSVWGDLFWAYYDLDTGVINSSGASGSGILRDVGIIDCGDGCYYCYLGGQRNGTGEPRFIVYLMDDSWGSTYIGGEVAEAGLYLQDPHIINNVGESDYTPHMGNGATLLVETTEGTPERHYLDTELYPINIGNDLFFGVFARDNILGGSLARNILMIITDNSGAHHAYVGYNLSDGSIFTTFDYGDTTLVDYGTIDFKDGWYYCWIKCNMGSSVNTLRCQLVMVNTSDELEYNGVGSYLWLYDVYGKELNIDVRCRKTYEDCKKYLRTDNFGGFRYLPSITERVVWWGRTPNL